MSCGSAQLGLQPRDQLLEDERLDEVVVGTGTERADLILGAALGGEHHDRRLGNLAQPRKQRDAVDLRHHDVEDDQFGIEDFDEF